MDGTLLKRHNMEKDTSGFYTLNEGKLFCAPNAVRAPTFDLFRKDKDTYTYPIGGWYWFDTKYDAEVFFEIKEENTR